MCSCLLPFDSTTSDSLLSTSSSCVGSSAFFTLHGRPTLRRDTVTSSVTLYVHTCVLLIADVLTRVIHRKQKQHDVNVLHFALRYKKKGINMKI